MIPYLKERRILFSDETLQSHSITSAGELAGIAHDLPNVIDAEAKEIPPANPDLECDNVDPRSDKQKRNDWLLDLRGLKKDAERTFPELADLLTEKSLTADWVSLEASAISDALRESFKRRFKKPWPFDGRGKKRKQGNKE